MKLVGLVLALAACGGFDEPPVLGRVAQDQPGCQAIETGVDGDGDGKIDDAEVTATTRLCGHASSLKCTGDGKALTGTIAIHTADDWRQLDDVTCIDGDLLVVGTPDPDMSLGKLATVTGNVAIAGNPSFTSLGGLAHLTAIGGTLLVQGNDGLVDLDGAAVPQLPALDVIANRHLPDLTGLDNLGCGTALTIASDDELASLYGLDTHTCIGSLTLRADAGLTSLAALERLATAGALDLDGIPAEVQLPSLASVGGTLHVGSVGGKTLVLPSLRSVGILAIDHSSLAVVDLPQLVTASTLRIESNPSLDGLRAPVVADDITIVGDPSLVTVVLGEIGQLGNLHVENTGLHDVSAFGALSHVTGDLTMVGNPIPPKVLKVWADRIEIDGHKTIE